ncbi:MAG: PQQ-dependent sugar dehydrogenase [Acidimicrobiales bacterium]
MAPSPPRVALVAFALIAAACGTTAETTVVPTVERSPEVVPPTTSPIEPQPEPEPSESPPTETTASAATPTPEPAPTTDPAELTVELPEGVAVTLTPVLSVSAPIAMSSIPGTANAVLGTKGGQVVEVAVGTEGLTVVNDLLDLSGEVSSELEQGLLGVAVSPSGEHLYVNFTNQNGDTHLEEWRFSDGALDPSSRRLVLEVDQPAANHNGGHVDFGPDGWLYMGLGDGGGRDDTFGHGQRTDSLLATIIRIDPRQTGESPYAVPADNPFVNGGGAPEVYLYGARNPWRFSFDSLTGDLWIGDVGQRRLEEINVNYTSDGRGLGTNLGWPDVEGTAPFSAAGPPAGDYTAPIYEYGRDDGCSVTGGKVYRGSNIPDLFGHYVYGDYCTSRIWGLASSESQGLLGRFDMAGFIQEGNPVSFYEDQAGELYILTLNGTILRIDPA